jgi:hypothetical protein
VYFHDLLTERSTTYRYPDSSYTQYHQQHVRLIAIINQNPAELCNIVIVNGNYELLPFRSVASNYLTFEFIPFRDMSLTLLLRAIVVTGAIQCHELTSLLRPPWSLVQGDEGYTSVFDK